MSPEPYYNVMRKYKDQFLKLYIWNVFWFCSLEMPAIYVCINYTSINKSIIHNIRMQNEIVPGGSNSSLEHDIEGNEEYSILQNKTLREIHRIFNFIGEKWLWSGQNHTNWWIAITMSRLGFCLFVYMIPNGI